MFSYASAHLYFRKSEIYNDLKTVTDPEQLTADMVRRMGEEYLEKYPIATSAHGNQAAAYFLSLYTEEPHKDSVEKRRLAYLTKAYELLTASFSKNTRGVLSQMIAPLIFNPDKILSPEDINQIGREYLKKYPIATCAHSNQIVARFLTAYSEEPPEKNSRKRWEHIAKAYALLSGSFSNGTHGVLARMINDLLFPNAFQMNANYTYTKKIAPNADKSKWFYRPTEISSTLLKIIELKYAKKSANHLSPSIQ